MAPVIQKPGLYVDVDVDEYFGDLCPLPSLTQSLIPDLVGKSPWHAAWLHPRLNPYGPGRESSKAQWFGEAVHRVALGRGRELSEIRYPNYQISSAREARDEAIRNNRIPILTAEYIRAQDLGRVLRRTIEVEFRGEAYVTEAMVCWVEETPFGPLWCRSLIDAFCPALGYILDPKVLRIPAIPSAFGPTAAKSGYHIQAAFNMRGIEAVMPEAAGRIRFANLVMENQAPHGHAGLAPDPEALAAADFEINLAINLFARCLHSRNWPSYPRTTQTYSLPKYKLQELAMTQYAADEGA